MKFKEDYLSSAYEGVVKPVVEQFGLHPLRIDEVQDSGKITDQVLEKIAESRFVLADLSGARPNCYYETGFAHALGKELILSINAKDSVHFDLAEYRFIEWATELEFRQKLIKRFESLMSPSVVLS
jgi:nucleoside 2-deoxyribosyltransferase